MVKGGYGPRRSDGPEPRGCPAMCLAVLLPDGRDQGWGPRAARMLIEHLKHDRGWHDITVDPLQDNGRAIRAWEKAGFRTERYRDDHPDGPSLLMRLSDWDIRLPISPSSENRECAPGLLCGRRDLHVQGEAADHLLGNGRQIRSSRAPESRHAAVRSGLG